MTATISFIVIPTGTGTPTKKNWAWSPGARNTYSMAATIPDIAEIRGFLKMRIREAKSRRSRRGRVESERKIVVRRGDEGTSFKPYWCDEDPGDRHRSESNCENLLVRL